MIADILEQMFYTRPEGDPLVLPSEFTLWSEERWLMKDGAKRWIERWKV